MKNIEKLVMEEPLIFQVWESFPCDRKKLDEKVKIRWYQDHWEINEDWEDRCSDSEFIGVLKTEVIRLMLKHPFSSRSKNNPNSYLASNCVIYDNYNCDKCKMKSKNCERECPFTYLTPSPFEMEWNTDEGFEENLCFEDYLDKLEFVKSSTDKLSDKIDEAIKMIGKGGIYGDDSEFDDFGGGENEGETDEQNEKHKTDIADFAEANSEGWGENEKSDMIELKINDMIKRAGGSSWGSTPAGLIEEITREKVVKQDLSHFIKGVSGKISVGRQSTRLRINRRVEEFAGRKRHFGAKILIALDTSGSMSSEDLKKTFSVIESLKYKAEMWICYCDTETTKPVKLRSETKRLNVTGRGGTDLQPVVGFSEDFDFTIIVTDGYMSELETTLRQVKTIGILFHSEDLYEEHIKDKAWSKFMCGFIKEARRRKEKTGF